MHGLLYTNFLSPVICASQPSPLSSLHARLLSESRTAPQTPAASRTPAWTKHWSEHITWGPRGKGRPPQSQLLPSDDGDDMIPSGSGGEPNITADVKIGKRKVETPRTTASASSPTPIRVLKHRRARRAMSHRPERGIRAQARRAAQREGERQQHRQHEEAHDGGRRAGVDGYDEDHRRRT